MKQENYKWILYSITLVILGTIGIQVYWNYKNYETNKQEYIADLQVVLDESVEQYYANLAKEKTFYRTTTVQDSNAKFPLSLFSHAMDSIEIRLMDVHNEDTTQSSKSKLIKKLDSISEYFKFPKHIESKDSLKMIVIQEHADSNYSTDSLERIFSTLHENHGKIDITLEDNFQMLTSQIVISLTNDSLDLVDIHGILDNLLKQRALNVDYQLEFKDKFDESVIRTNKTTKKFPLKLTSNSVYLPENSKMTLSFSDIKFQVLKRIYLGILISTILILAVIFCLFYLLKIIQKQKQVSEIKNDFISNITHEFKTPIATIAVALESIRNFNASAHPERSETYLDMSKEQLDKLNTMVEKLLETSTLDSNTLELYKEQVEVVGLIEKVIQYHQIHSTHKTIGFKTNVKSLTTLVDAFHFENVINNLVDNAVKYGGNTIEIELRTLGNLLEIYIKDTGKSLTKSDADHLFEKFYRQPKGNKHDVKGFGIGLYYSKKIIEKHQGQLTLSFDKQFTIFKISMPYE